MFLAAEGLVIDAEVIAAEAEQVEPEPESTLEYAYREILRTTGWFVLYGTGGFAIVCILVGAFEGLIGK